MKCPKCGVENTPEAVNCAGCGTQIEVPDGYAPPKRNNSLIFAIGCPFVLIAVLGALFFPIFSGLRQYHLQQSCQVNMREIGTAANMYVQDYNTLLPNSVLCGDSFDSFNRKGVLPPPDSATSKSWPMLLHPYMKHKDSIWCPSDPADWSPNGPDIGQTPYVSYFWKASVDEAWRHGYKREGDYGFPDQQILFYEHNNWHWGDDAKGQADGVRVNVTFMDGHVQGVNIRNSGGARVSPSNAGEPCYYNATGKSGSPQYSTGRNWDPHKYYDSLP